MKQVGWFVLIKRNGHVAYDYFHNKRAAENCIFHRQMLMDRYSAQCLPAFIDESHDDKLKESGNFLEK